MRVLYMLNGKNMDTYLLLKYLKCTATPAEETTVQEWLADDPDGSHAKQFREAHELFNGITIYGDDLVRKTDGKKHSFRKLVFAAMRVAAVVLIVAGVGLWVKNDTLDSISGKTERISVPAGKSLCMTLEDGTTMWLNAGSEVEYPSVFSRKERNVKVHSGEVLFDVVHDGKRPFYVDSYAAKIAVLGTKFNVKVDREHGKYSAALLRGSIKVSSHGNENDIYILKPDEIVELVDNRLRVGRVENTELVTCWTDGLINVSGVSFEELMRTFELAFDVDIEIMSDKMPEISFTRGKIRVSDGLDHALEVLKLASDFDYERDFESEGQLS